MEVQEVDTACTNDNDGDGVINGEDAFPNDPDEWNDNDGDGTGDNADPDDDRVTAILTRMMNSRWGRAYQQTPLRGANTRTQRFTLSIEYEGHNSFDEYTAVGTVPGADGPGLGCPIPELIRRMGEFFDIRFGINKFGH